MSTTIDLRSGALLGVRREAAAWPARRAPAVATPAKRAPARPRALPGAGRVHAPRPAAALGRLNPLKFAARAQLRGAGLFGVATFCLSLLGLVYLVQISNVARYGYLLADVQNRQAEVERRNELLTYRLSNELGLARVGDLAQREYGMRPFDRPAGAATGGEQRSSAGTKPSPTAAAPIGGPQHRFITVQRPAPTPPVIAPPRPDRAGLVDRLWNRFVGVGSARGE